MILERLIYDHLSLNTQCNDEAEDVKDEGKERGGMLFNVYLFLSVSLISIVYSLFVVHPRPFLSLLFPLVCNHP